MIYLRLKQELKSVIILNFSLTKKLELCMSRFHRRFHPQQSDKKSKNETGNSAVMFIKTQNIIKVKCENMFSLVSSFKFSHIFWRLFCYKVYPENSCWEFPQIIKFYYIWGPKSPKKWTKLAFLYLCAAHNKECLLRGSQISLSYFFVERK